MSKYWSHLHERQRETSQCFLFSADLRRACFGAVFWILSVVLNRCLLLILIYLPLLHPHALEASTGPVLGGGGGGGGLDVCARLCMCADDVSFIQYE